MLTALSISSRARAWLRRSPPARVLHLFDEACNLVADDGDVLSLVTESVGDGPFNLVLPAVDFTSLLSHDTRVESFEDRLRLGGIEIDARSARNWEARPDWREIRANAGRLRSGLKHLLEILEDSALDDGLAVLIVDFPKRRSRLAEELIRQARMPAENLVQGLRKADASLCRHATGELAGLGGGLTPAGDDWIVGALLGAWVLQPSKEAAQLGDTVAQAARHSPPLSLCWIRAAAAGECSARWHALLDALQREDETSIRSAAQDILAQGHTSGADALAGFIAVLQGV